MTQEKTWLFWQADRHQWGEGKIHLVEEGQDVERPKTLCGKTLGDACPGKWVPGSLPIAEVTCQGCSNALDARRQREKREAEWRERQLALSLERAGKDQEWQERYREYLDSLEWRRKRTLVLRRENGPDSGL